MPDRVKSWLMFVPAVRLAVMPYNDETAAIECAECGAELFAYEHARTDNTIDLVHLVDGVKRHLESSHGG